MWQGDWHFLIHFAAVFCLNCCPRVLHHCPFSYDMYKANRLFLGGLTLPRHVWLYSLPITFWWSVLCLHNHAWVSYHFESLLIGQFGFIYKLFLNWDVVLFKSLLCARTFVRLPPMSCVSWPVNLPLLNCCQVHVIWYVTK